MLILEKDMKLMLDGKSNDAENDIEHVNIETARTIKSSS